MISRKPNRQRIGIPWAAAIATSVVVAFAPNAFARPAISFAGIAPSSFPESFLWNAGDGSSGKVEVSLLKAPSSGTPFLESPNLYMGLEHTTGAVGVETLWFIRLTFDRPVSVEVSNFETYTAYERTHLVSNGNSWTGGFVSGPVNGYIDSNPSTGVVESLGTADITFYGNSNAGDSVGWPYGFFQSKFLTTLDVGYGVVLPNGADANGVLIDVVSSVPEPSHYWVMASLVCLGHSAKRSAASWRSCVRRDRGNCLPPQLTRPQ